MNREVNGDLCPTYLVNQVEFVDIRDLGREQLVSNMLQFALWFPFLLTLFAVLQNRKTWQHITRVILAAWNESILSYKQISLAYFWDVSFQMSDLNKWSKQHREIISFFINKSTVEQHLY